MSVVVVVDGMLHPTSLGSAQTGPSLLIAPPQHIELPPGSLPHPLPPHRPHDAAQQTLPLLMPSAHRASGGQYFEVVAVAAAVVVAVVAVVVAVVAVVVVGAAVGVGVGVVDGSAATSAQMVQPGRRTDPSETHWNVSPAAIATSAGPCPLVAYGTPFTVM